VSKASGVAKSAGDFGLKKQDSNRERAARKCRACRCGGDFLNLELVFAD